MPKYKIVWEERYIKEVEAEDKREAEDMFEELTTKEMNEAYQETTHFEIEEVS